MMTNWLASYRTYCLSIAFAHFIIFTCFFPYFVFCTVFIFVIFVVSWMWCDLVHHIEQANRQEILNLLDTCTSDQTRIILAHQLFLHDKNSVFGDPYQLYG